MPLTNPDAPVAVPVDQVLRVAEQALALIGASFAGSGHGAVAEQIVALWRAGKLAELADLLDMMRQALPPRPEAMN